MKPASTIAQERPASLSRDLRKGRKKDRHESESTSNGSHETAPELAGPVILSDQEIIARIRAKLAHTTHQLRWCPDSGEHANGGFHIVDAMRNFVLDRHITPAGYARDLGVLKSGD